MPEAPASAMDEPKGSETASEPVVEVPVEDKAVEMHRPHAQVPLQECSSVMSEEDARQEAQEITAEPSPAMEAANTAVPPQKEKFNLILFIKKLLGFLHRGKDASTIPTDEAVSEPVPSPAPPEAENGDETVSGAPAFEEDVAQEPEPVTQEKRKCRLKWPFHRKKKDSIDFEDEPLEDEPLEDEPREEPEADQPDNGVDENYAHEGAITEEEDEATPLKKRRFLFFGRKKHKEDDDAEAPSEGKKKKRKKKKHISKKERKEMEVAEMRKKFQETANYDGYYDDRLPPDYGQIDEGKGQMNWASLLLLVIALSLVIFIVFKLQSLL